MKRHNTTHLLVWALIAAMPLWFGSCSKKSTDAVTPSAIEGTWRYSGFKINPAVYSLKNGQKTGDILAYYADNAASLGTDITTCFTTTTLTFLSGGKLTGAAGSKCTPTTSTELVGANSTWKVDGSKLTITTVTNGATTSEVFDTVLSGNSLKISQTDTDFDYDGDGKKDTATTTLELTKM